MIFPEITSLFDFQLFFFLSSSDLLFEYPVFNSVPTNIRDVIIRKEAPQV